MLRANCVFLLGKKGSMEDIPHSSSILRVVLDLVGVQQRSFKKVEVPATAQDNSGRTLTQYQAAGPCSGSIPFARPIHDLQNSDISWGCLLLAQGELFITAHPDTVQQPSIPTMHIPTKNPTTKKQNNQTSTIYSIASPTNPTLQSKKVPEQRTTKVLT